MSSWILCAVAVVLAVLALRRAASNQSRGWTIATGIMIIAALTWNSSEFVCIGVIIMSAMILLTPTWFFWNRLWLHEIKSDETVGWFVDYWGSHIPWHGPTNAISDRVAEHHGWINGVITRHLDLTRTKQDNNTVSKTQQKIRVVLTAQPWHQTPTQFHRRSRRLLRVLALVCKEQAGWGYDTSKETIETDLRRIASMSPRPPTYTITVESRSQ